MKGFPGASLQADWGPLSWWGIAMDPEYFGTEQVTAEDRAYRGSRFSEVRDAMFANPYQQVWGGAGEPPLPVYR